MSLWKKMSFTIIAVIVLITGLCGVISYRTVQSVIIQNKKEEMGNMLNLIDMNITQHIETLDRLIDVISDLVFAPNKMINETGVKIFGETELFILEQEINVFPSVKNLYALNQQDEIFYQYKMSQISLEELFVQLGEDKVKQNKNIWISLEDGSIFLLRTIWVEGEKKGSIVLEFNPEIFMQLLINNLSTFHHQITLITDKNGKVICSNTSVPAEYLNIVKERYDTGEHTFQFNWSNVSYFACGQYNGVTGWRLFSIVATKDIFPQLQLLKNRVITITVISVLMGFLISFLLAWTITKPLKELSKAMEKAQIGNFDIQVHTKQKDEIGSLIQSYNFMLGEIKRLIHVVTEEKMAQKTAELNALQAQINPHFLYNTLDTINWMLLARGEDDISDLIVRLGELLKYSISGANTLVPLQEEVRYIRNYLEIQKCRMEERLEYAISIEEACNAYPCPKLLLQPLVENAIKHGLEPLVRGGKVCIIAVIDQGELKITVIDDGQGMEAEKIQDIRLDKRVGLNNVEKRIKLIYGQNYGLRIHSQKNNGTTVEIHLPLIVEGVFHEDYDCR